MTITELTNTFLSYLQRNNLQQGNPYPSAWLEKQANDFRDAMLYAEGRIAEILPSNETGENVLRFIQEIHRHCASECYRMHLNAERGHTVQNERPGILRQCEEMSTNTIPVLDCYTQEDLNFLRIGKMPQILDGRLQRMNINPRTLSSHQKEQAMHGQPAWLSGNDLIQIAAYIESHFGQQANYYFLCAYYKEHYLKGEHTDQKSIMFANYIKKEIQQLSQKLNLRFEEKTALTVEEENAYNRVYKVYPMPEQVNDLFSMYVREINHKIRHLESGNVDKMARFCFETFNQYMQIHPYMDANYRTISIFINAVLSHFGYALMDFHDNDFKRKLGIPFNGQAPDESIAISAFKGSLTRKTVFADATEATIKLSACSDLFKRYKTSTFDQAIRRTAASGKHEDLAAFLSQHPEEIDCVDQTPDKGFTALHLAIQNNHPLCIIELLKFNARYDITDKMGRTAVDLCIEKSNVEISRLILEAILKKYIKGNDRDLEKVLRTVANKGDLSAVKMLINQGVCVDSVGPKLGKTALHEATEKGHVDIVAFLIQSNANTEIIDCSGKKAMDYAQGNEALIHLFSNAEIGRSNKV